MEQMLPHPSLRRHWKERSCGHLATGGPVQSPWLGVWGGLPAPGLRALPPRDCLKVICPCAWLMSPTMDPTDVWTHLVTPAATTYPTHNFRMSSSPLSPPLAWPWRGPALLPCILLSFWLQCFGGFLTTWATREALSFLLYYYILVIAQIPFYYIFRIFASESFLMTGLPQWLNGNESACNAGASGGPWVHSLGGEYPLEKEMVTHSSILAWKIPWMEEPAELQSIGLQSTEHNWVTKQQQHFCWTKFATMEFVLAGGLVAKLCPTLVTPWTVACQAPLSMGFSRHLCQQNW